MVFFGKLKRIFKIKNCLIVLFYQLVGDAQIVPSASLCDPFIPLTVVARLMGALSRYGLEDRRSPIFRSRQTR